MAQDEHEAIWQPDMLLQYPMDSNAMVHDLDAERIDLLLTYIEQATLSEQLAAIVAKVVEHHPRYLRVKELFETIEAYRRIGQAMWYVLIWSDAPPLTITWPRRESLGRHWRTSRTLRAISRTWPYRQRATSSVSTPATKVRKRHWKWLWRRMPVTRPCLVVSATAFTFGGSTTLMTTSATLSPSA